MSTTDGYPPADVSGVPFGVREEGVKQEGDPSHMSAHYVRERIQRPIDELLGERNALLQEIRDLKERVVNQQILVDREAEWVAKWRDQSRVLMQTRTALDEANRVIEDKRYYTPVPKADIHFVKSASGPSSPMLVIQESEAAIADVRMVGAVVSLDDFGIDILLRILRTLRDTAKREP